MASPVTRTLARLPRRAGPLVRGRRFLGRFTLDVASEVTPWREYACTAEARGGCDFGFDEKPLAFIATCERN